MDTEKQRIIQEYVPGKQITLAHIIARPDPSMLSKVGLSDIDVSAVGIMTITPSEAALIAADLVLKAANTEIGYVDRFNGSLVITGLVSDVESSLQAVTRFLFEEMGFTPCRITRS